MPIVDRREFGGRFTVKENSQRLANYRYLEVQLMEMIGGWSHTTPQLAFKADLGTTSMTTPRRPICWASGWSNCARGRERRSPATDEFARLCEQIWNLTRPCRASWRSTGCWSRTW